MLVAPDTGPGSIAPDGRVAALPAHQPHRCTCSLGRRCVNTSGRGYWKQPRELSTPSTAQDTRQRLECDCRALGRIFRVGSGVCLCRGVGEIVKTQAKQASRESLPHRTAPTYRPEPPSPTADLFALVRVVDENSLGQRLLQLGADLYCEGVFATYAERLRHVISREQFATSVCGRDLAGKVETFAQAFERVSGLPLAAKSGAKR